MASEYASDDLPSRRGNAGRAIRVAKPEEGEARGEVFHLLRALVLVVGVTALIGWLVS
jgi:hypothetical protein